MEKWNTPFILVLVVLSFCSIFAMLSTNSSLVSPNFFDLKHLKRSLDDIGFLSRYRLTESSVNPSVLKIKRAVYNNSITVARPGLDVLFSLGVWHSVILKAMCFTQLKHQLRIKSLLGNEM